MRQKNWPFSIFKGLPRYHTAKEGNNPFPFLPFFPLSWPASSFSHFFHSSYFFTFPFSFSPALNRRNFFSIPYCQKMVLAIFLHFPSRKWQNCDLNATRMNKVWGSKQTPNLPAINAERRLVSPMSSQFEDERLSPVYHIILQEAHLADYCGMNAVCDRVKYSSNPVMNARLMQIVWTDQKLISDRPLYMMRLECRSHTGCIIRLTRPSVCLSVCLFLSF